MSNVDRDKYYGLIFCYYSATFIWKFSSSPPTFRKVQHDSVERFFLGAKPFSELRGPDLQHVNVDSRPIMTPLSYTMTMLSYVSW
jgi:hypothetical protein